MKRIKICGIAVVLLFAAFAWAQDTRDESKPQQQDQPKQDESRPEPKKDAAPPSHRDEMRQNESRQNEMKPPQQEEEKPGKAEKQENEKAPRDEARPAHEEHGQEAERGQAAPSGQHARPAGKSAHIPDEKFKASYGRQHSFAVNRVINQTTIVAGQTNFVYGGYTFVFLDPWPADWMFTDDVYVDYVDGDYFLIDLVHPGMRVALFVQG